MALENTHSQTLEALESFIAAQRLLIARQRDDIERLQLLRRDMHENFSAVLDHMNDELGHTAFHLSAQTDLRLTLPKGIHWSVFDKADTTPLHTLASQHRQKYAARTTPSTTQQSCLSELQLLVKKARKEMIDPVLEWVAKSTTHLNLDPDDDDEEDEAIDPLERKRYEERMKIMELKRRKIRGGGSGLSLLTTRNVVFVRDDVEDETHDVDVGVWGDDNLNGCQRMQADEADSQSQRVQKTHSGPTKTKKANNGTEEDLARMPMQKNLTGGEGRPRKKAKTVRSPKRTVKRKSAILPKNSTSATPDATTDEAVLTQPMSPKPRSDTYKQAWSMDEQHLLEQLLEDIPDGEKNRWLKISQAMGGRRTPRQVASRVQKYFEKLKKFGVAVD